jgi:hypothetical protein
MDEFDNFDMEESIGIIDIKSRSKSQGGNPKKYEEW